MRQDSDLGCLFPEPVLLTTMFYYLNISKVKWSASGEWRIKGPGELNTHTHTHTKPKKSESKSRLHHCLPAFVGDSCEFKMSKSM